MSSTRIIASRLAPCAAKASSSLSTKRLLTTQGSMAVERLRGALEEYRSQNFTRCVPSRFQKEIVKATKIDDSRVGAEGVHRLIDNIGAENKVSHADVDTIFAEIGDGKTIPAERLIQMIP